MKLKKLLNLNLKKFVLMIIAFIILIILHNIIYAITGFEEAVFFTLALVVIPVFLLLSIIYTLLGTKKKK